VDDCFCAMTLQIHHLQTFGSSTVLRDSFPWVGLQRKVGSQCNISNITNCIAFLVEDQQGKALSVHMHVCITLTIAVMMSEHEKMLLI
jgi:hypothetical protein